MTSAPDPVAHDESALFGERVLRIIDSGRRVGTYKLALLLALLDACASESGPMGAAPEVLHTRVIATHVLRLYLPQSASFVVGEDPVTLRQITGAGSAMFRAVAGLQHAAKHAGCKNIAVVAQQLPDQYESTLDEVERTFARYPLRLLQVVDGHDIRFLYDIGWGANVSLRQLHSQRDGLVRFRPGAADALVRLGPLVRPLVEAHWTREVAKLNRVGQEQERLHAHLFGTSRQTFPISLRAGLAELHHGCCFYCGGRLPNRWDLDHLIPWSRHPNDAIENLVPADPRCNGAKSDSLPATSHVERWTDHLASNTDQLQHLAATARWMTDRNHTIAVVRSTYRHLAVGTPLWKAVGNAEPYRGDPPSTTSP